jgi:hypothetical protein
MTYGKLIGGRKGETYHSACPIFRLRFAPGFSLFQRWQIRVFGELRPPPVED